MKATIRDLKVCLRIERGQYARDRTTVLRAFVESDASGACMPGEKWGVLTVCIPGTPLAEDQVLVKTWSENELWAREVAQQIGLEDTGRRVSAGWTEAEIWRWRT